MIRGMAQTPQVELPDGRRIDYEIRTSKRTRSLRLKLTAREGLVVTSPQGIKYERITQLVADKNGWIVEHLKQFDEVRHLLVGQNSTRPQAFDLAALAESWQVEYRQTRGKTVGARMEPPGRVLVYGAVSDGQRCQAALRRWLARRAKETLGHWIASLSEETGLKYNSLTIKSQRTRWGSCSERGIVSLNCKLLFLPRELVRYVLIHELCHTLEHRHSTRFWALVRSFEPRVEALHRRMRDAWKQIPPWAHPVRAGREEL